MNTTVVVVCALVIALFTTSCSKDNDIPDAEKNAIQALNNIVGNYRGNLAATYGTTTTIWPGINWTVDKNSTITVNNFPYQLLANGVSKNTASSLYTTLINEKQRLLKLYITTIQPQDDKSYERTNNVKSTLQTALKLPHGIMTLVFSHLFIRTLVRIVIITLFSLFCCKDTLFYLFINQKSLSFHFLAVSLQQNNENRVIITIRTKVRIIK